MLPLPGVPTVSVRPGVVAGGVGAMIPPVLMSPPMPTSTPMSTPAPGSVMLPVPVSRTASRMVPRSTSEPLPGVVARRSRRSWPRRRRGRRRCCRRPSPGSTGRCRRRPRRPGCRRRSGRTRGRRCRPGSRRPRGRPRAAVRRGAGTGWPWRRRSGWCRPRRRPGPAGWPRPGPTRWWRAGRAGSRSRRRRRRRGALRTLARIAPEPSPARPAWTVPPARSVQPSSLDRTRPSAQTRTCAEVGRPSRAVASAEISPGAGGAGAEGQQAPAERRPAPMARFIHKFTWRTLLASGFEDVDHVARVARRERRAGGRSAR